MTLDTYDKDLDLWRYCEYFMDHAASGINLVSFDLIRRTDQGTDTADAYACERLTRPVLAKSARGIKRLVRDYAERNRLGQLEGTAKSLEETLKSNLQEAVLRHLENALETDLIQAAQGEDSPMLFLILPAIYHTYYKNRTASGMGLPPWFSRIFYPLLIKSQKGNVSKLEEWKTVLRQHFFPLWEAAGSPGEKLKNFFEHRVTRKIVSYALAGIMKFLQEEKDKTYYLFEVTHKLQTRDTKFFHILMVNGLNGILNRKKRFASQIPASGAGQETQISVLPRDQIKDIVDSAVAKHFDPALDLCVQYAISLTKEQPREKLARQFDKVFLAMNRVLWKELLLMADVRRRVALRTHHLLRLLIHYLFEARGTDRAFWQKYIASVDRIITCAFEEDRDRLGRINTLLEKRLSCYRDVEKYKGTDWEGFYKDPESRDLAFGVLKELALKARSERDHNLPALWFSSQVEKGVDDQALYRFFRQGPDTA